MCVQLSWLLQQCLSKAVNLPFNTFQTYLSILLGIFSGQRTMCLELLQKMAYMINNDDEYTGTVSNICSKKVLN